MQSKNKFQILNNDIFGILDYESNLKIKNIPLKMHYKEWNFLSVKKYIVFLASIASMRNTIFLNKDATSKDKPHANSNKREWICKDQIFSTFRTGNDYNTY